LSVIKPWLNSHAPMHYQWFCKQNKFNETLPLHDNVTGILSLDQNNMAQNIPRFVICTMENFNTTQNTSSYFHDVNTLLTYRDHLYVDTVNIMDKWETLADNSKRHNVYLQKEGWPFVTSTFPQNTAVQYIKITFLFSVK
jgi:hypothetical protein